MPQHPILVNHSIVYPGLFCYRCYLFRQYHCNTVCVKHPLYLPRGYSILMVVQGRPISNSPIRNQKTPNYFFIPEIVFAIFSPFTPGKNAFVYQIFNQFIGIIHLISQLPFISSKVTSSSS